MYTCMQLSECIVRLWAQQIIMETDKGEAMRKKRRLIHTDPKLNDQTCHSHA